MIDIDKKDRQRIVNGIEYLVAHGDNGTVEKMMKVCDITFAEYRVICDLAMPAIREHSDVFTNKYRAGYYKGCLTRKLEEAQMVLNKYRKEGKIDESDLLVLAERDGERFVPAGSEDNDGEEGHPEEWAV